MRISDWSSDVCSSDLRLKAIGESDLARNLAALKSACDTFAPDKSLKECVAKEAADKPAGGAVAGARKQLASLRQFIVDKNLVRSEEHTSELQSLMRSSYAVFCLKKQPTSKPHAPQHTTMS